MKSEASATVLDPVEAPTRRHVLVISAEAELAATVDSALKQIGVPAVVDLVEGYFLALGHLATQAAVKPDTVITRVEDIDEPLDTIASALRRLAPRSQMIVICPPEREPQAIAAVAAGFDNYLLDPIDPKELPRMMGRSSAAADEESAWVEALEREVRLRSLAEQSNLVVRSPVVTVEAVPAGEGLGDIDLIDRLMSFPDDVAPLAVTMIAQSLGDDRLGWAARQSDVPGGHAGVIVQYDGHHYGVLYGPASVTREKLEPWAGWLGRWLALQGRMQGLWELALRDELTGVWGRRYLMRFLETIIEQAARQRFRVTVLVFDIDDFKIYNDRYGHGAGDEILAESARLMRSVVREHDVVARIGGDEFGVIFWDAEVPRQPNSEHPASIRSAARRFQHAICQHKYPKLAEEAPGTLTISGGLASFPWDGQTANELLERADEMALQSKRQGKNVITFGPGSLEMCNRRFVEHT